MPRRCMLYAAIRPRSSSAFGEDSGRLRLRVATAQLYGGTETERTAALNSADPCALPWIAASLARLEEVLADLTG